MTKKTHRIPMRATPKSVPALQLAASSSTLNSVGHKIDRTTSVNVSRTTDRFYNNPRTMSAIKLTASSTTMNNVGHKTDRI
ncbi:hypothetical protein DPMN_125925 [Dreissena polymorpha]|uniref:Uncharacterized protein n=1 Tax=Dreissena polymorpha TaxID=45954 RepID=A0A9D4GWC1_DREPO|nr:hypothetical protein DPMN_125925 [Dreissena polymorpha]